MSFAVIAVQIMAIIYLTLGMRGFLDANFFENLATDVQKNTAVSFMFGVFGIILGMVFISHPNVRLTDWTVIIAIVGWISIFKGLTILLVPTEFMNYFAGVRSKKNAFAISIAAVILGLVFGYFGFIA